MKTTASKITFIPSKPENLKFKFVFDTSEVSFCDAQSYQDAAILALAARIRAKKSRKLVGAWNRADDGTWQHVLVNEIKLNF